MRWLCGRPMVAIGVFGGSNDYRSEQCEGVQNAWRRLRRRATRALDQHVECRRPLQLYLPRTAADLSDCADPGEV